MLDEIIKLPSTGPLREALREKGQFWTPGWVAEAMVGYIIADGCNDIFDPAVGAGAFFRAAKVIAGETGRHFSFSGTEVDADALRQARQSGLSEDDLSDVRIADFLFNPPDKPLRAIVANPPYIRHHRVLNGTKIELKKLAMNIMGHVLDGRAGLHIYFLLQALKLLDTGGRLAFIMPADTCEGIFSTKLWRWITGNYCLEAVITFATGASPFEQVDTNPVIFFIKNARPTESFFWAKCNERQTGHLKSWVLSGFQTVDGNALSVSCRSIVEGLATGLSREPLLEQHTGPILGDYVRVMRGIATGANEFFFLTAKQVEDINIPEEFLLRAIGRTRDVQGDEISIAMLESLEKAGRPTLLFAPDKRPLDEFPPQVQEYLKRGVAMGLPQKALISQRAPWYKMEVRNAPPILFAYLGRRNARFIMNSAEIMPLTGFLCVYPKSGDPAFIRKLWQVLQHPETIANLALVGKSYGSGAIKVEPRALERLPLPASAMSQVRLEIPASKLHAAQSQGNQIYAQMSLLQ